MTWILSEQDEAPPFVCVSTVEVDVFSACELWAQQGLPWGLMANGYVPLRFTNLPNSLTRIAFSTEAPLTHGLLVGKGGQENLTWVYGAGVLRTGCGRRPALRTLGGLVQSSDAHPLGPCRPFGDLFFPSPFLL